MHTTSAPAIRTQDSETGFSTAESSRNSTDMTFRGTIQESPVGSREVV